ncbi:MAG TPA: hypothetical protein VF665_01630 [Longimicrobium sp.]|uniref:hypothetical protein n=1 Tax=Longimicrobium sp. TaxID=2029185 RepID=UPI002EDB3F32
MRFAPVPLAVAGLLALAPSLAAQRPHEPGAIEDNSFLLEEAYNQESNEVQHVLTFQRSRDGGEREIAFTQEWPLWSERHQISYTVPYLRTPATSGFGDAEVAYRYQLSQSRAWVAPTLAVTLPTGRELLGGGRSGVEALVPVSLHLTDAFAAHTNAGVHVLAGVDDGEPTRGVSLGQSLVWLAHPRVNLMVEALWERDDTDGEVEEEFFVSPGVRGLFTVGGAQVVPGIALPIGVGASNGDRQLFVYLSVEHAFRRGN